MFALTVEIEKLADALLLPLRGGRSGWGFLNEYPPLNSPPSGGDFKAKREKNSFQLLTGT